MKETVLLISKFNSEPFVTKRGKNYYVEGVKYTDGVKLLLDAVKNAKVVEWDEINKQKNKTSKKKMWELYFNHQWSRGGLILWHNPTELWNCELTRQEKLPCQKCGAKMRMYYNPYCPICDGFKKTKKGHNYKYAHMIDYIEAKYQLDTRTYSEHKFKVKNMFSWNVKHLFEWENKNFPCMAEFRKNPVKGYGMNQAGLDFLDSKEGRDFVDQMHIVYREAPDGKCKEIPYWDFWHFMLEEYFHDDPTDFVLNLAVTNDCIRYVNWKEVREVAKEEWQQELADLFVKEFGDKTYKVEISW